MTITKDKRHFSTLMRDTNRAFLPLEKQAEATLEVGFVLQPHFSLASFTAAVDTLVTANLVCTTPLFRYQSYAIEASPVLSDLGIEIATQGSLNTLIDQPLPDLLIICGGYRCSTQPNTALTRLLKLADKQDRLIGSLWNGAIALAHAGLLDQLNCALHPDNHAYMHEQFPKVNVSKQVSIIEGKRLTSAGPMSAMGMMLTLISQLRGNDVTRAVREIISCDQLSESSDVQINPLEDNPRLPQNLRDIMTLMAANIEEPMSLEELAACAGVSRRQIERLFQSHLETSPGRYYLELRITHARRLLLQSNESITSITLACGFVSTSHFSNCYKDYFGVSPSHAREQAR
ncbi:GlxA family transcriptional regulator [Marinomonas algarum]|uniref:GlxA family transcriptional regulator n=1 Tax=Marinomonas algarum TaxID=2883105 RepID=A0A9X1IJM4_9GAMM|nr:GlxA family transcriptional regulator [Marinomonas algarum]MCB5160492.1 GlxA family transcriptional regulator [Marinomonas algarum]